MHWIGFEPGRRRVGCFVEAMERFRAARLAEQGPRRRRPALTEAQRQAVLGAAAEIADAGSMPLAEAATIVGARASIEPRRVRAVLAGSGLGFRARRRSSRDERRLAYRAWRRGADPRAIAARIGRDRAATWRAVNAGRRAALRSLVLPPVDPLPTFEHAAAAEVLLAPDAVRRGLCARALPAEALALLREAPPVALPGRAGEVDACRRLVAMRFLLWRAARAVARLGSSPTSHELDRIETDLRNAAALRRTLVLHALPAVLGRIEAMIGASLLQAPGELLGAALRRAVTVTVGSLDSADGLDAAEGRLRTARHAALLMDRDLALRPIEAIGRRASPGAGAAARTVPIADPEAIMAPWSALLPFAQPPARLAECGARARALLERRHGWSGALAPTVTELAAEERVAPSILQHRLQEAWTRRGP